MREKGETFHAVVREEVSKMWGAYYNMQHYNNMQYYYNMQYSDPYAYYDNMQQSMQRYQQHDDEWPHRPPPGLEVVDYHGGSQAPEPWNSEVYQQHDDEWPHRPPPGLEVVDYHGGSQAPEPWNSEVYQQHDDEWPHRPHPGLEVVDYHGSQAPEPRNSRFQETRWLHQETEEEIISRLQEIREDLARAAWKKLDSALQMSLEFEPELSTCIERAIFFFDYQGADSTPRGAVDALRHTTQAMEMVGGGGPLYTELDAAVKKVRDSLSVRAALAALPMGDKKKYESVLEAAHGGRIDDEEKSRLMQSYRKIVWEQFEEAFPSNNKLENMQRGEPRPRRERGGRPATIRA